MEELSNVEVTSTLCERPPFAMALLGWCQPSAPQVLCNERMSENNMPPIPHIKMPKGGSSGSKHFLGGKSWRFLGIPRVLLQKGAVLVPRWASNIHLGGTCWVPSSDGGRAPLGPPHTSPPQAHSWWATSPWDTVRRQGAGRPMAR